MAFRHLLYPVLGVAVLSAMILDCNTRTPHESWHVEYRNLWTGTSSPESFNSLNYPEAEAISLLPPSEKRVISFSVYGTASRYLDGALRNLELLPIYFPGWTVYFYIDDSVPLDILGRLITPHSEIRPVDARMRTIPGAYWRFLVADDPTVERYILRDVDSRLSARDRLAVDEWVKSLEPFHVMRDHPAHCGWPINAGMWGGIKGAVKNMTQLVYEWVEADGIDFQYDQDQRFLKDIIWPLVVHEHLAHDSHCCHLFSNGRPFPSKRPESYEHVGQVFFGDDKPRQGDIDMLVSQKAPVECRLHPDWEYG